MGDLEQRVARGIAAELGMQDGCAPFELPDDLKLGWLDQGEVDFAAIARAIIPLVLEEAAKVAEDRRKIFVSGPDVRQYVTFSPTEVAAAIRALGEQCNGR